MGVTAYHWYLNSLFNVDVCFSISLISETKTDIYKEMESLSDCEKGYYSAALAPLQVEFVARAPTKVKTLIRLIKYWRKTEFKVRYIYIYI